jgi:hypothetical protein
MTPTKQKIIDEIIVEIEGGKSYTETLVVNGSKWKLPSTTYSRYWNIANEQYKVVQDRRRELSESIGTEAHIEAIKLNLWGKIEKLKILEKIATADIEIEKVFFDKGVPKKVGVKPDATDRMKAIEIHNKMMGDNAAEKHEVTNYEPTIVNGV